MDPEPEQSIIDRAIGDVRVAVAFMTRLRVGASENDLAGACWAFPVAGLLVGTAGGAVFAAAFAFGVPPVAAALLALMTTAMLTGALHEDGLADTADGFGGAEPERRLEIMRDSRIGAYGVLALIFSVGLRTAALAALSEPGIGFVAIVAAATLSRGLLPGMMHGLPLASSSGLATAVGRPTKAIATLAAGLGALAAISYLGFATGVAAVIIAVICIAAVALLARRLIGGYNGDTLGAAQQIAETAVLIGIAAGL
ncbi:MAG: adenosylcobinamide-GDP ribazoletransferase [Alphaproteobacteria bacterium]|nr:adenosylcobinamide-GDP ribazoletransferase [Alphaproteobacteria bacterium]